MEACILILRRKKKKKGNAQIDIMITSYNAINSYEYVNRGIDGGLAGGWLHADRSARVGGTLTGFNLPVLDLEQLQYWIDEKHLENKKQCAEQ